MQSFTYGWKSAFFLRESMAVPKSEGIRYFFVLQTRRCKTPAKTSVNSASRKTSRSSSSTMPVDFLFEKSSCHNGPTTTYCDENGRKTAELNIYSFPRDDASTSAGKTIITMINQLCVSQCYTTRRVHSFPTPETYHGLTCLGTNRSTAGSSQQLPLPPERSRVGKFSQEKSVSWPDIELAKFRVLESSGRATDKLVEIVAHAFARFVTWSLLIEPVAKTTQSYELKLASVNRANRPESMEQVDLAFPPDVFILSCWETLPTKELISPMH